MSYHRENSSGRIPYTESCSLFFLAVPHRRDGEEPGRDGRLDEAEEDALGDQTAVVLDYDREETDDTPEEDAD